MLFRDVAAGAVIVSEAGGLIFDPYVTTHPAFSFLRGEKVLMENIEIKQD